MVRRFVLNRVLLRSNHPRHQLSGVSEKVFPGTLKVLAIAYSACNLLFFREEVQRTSSKSEEIHSHVGKNRFFWCERFWFGSGFSFWLGSGSRLDRIYLLQLHTSSQYIQLHKKTECAQLNHPGKVQRCGSGSMRKKFGFRRNIRIRHMQYHCIKNTWKVTG